VRRRIALVGLGMAVTPHARSLLDLADRGEVAYAFSPSEARRRAFAARFPFPLADDLERVLADRSVTALLILTPPNTHLELVRRAAAAGKHVLLEKPLEVDCQRAAAAVQACAVAGVTLGVVLQHRFRPGARQLKALLDAGRLGRLVACSGHFSLWRPQSYYDQPGRGTRARDGGGVLLTQAIHSLDLMLWLAGPVAEVAGYAATTPLHRMETEDLVAAALRFAGGALGSLQATTAAFPGFPERIEFIGEQGTASLAGTALQVALADGSRIERQADPAPGGVGADPMAFPHDYHRALIADFLAALDAGAAPLVGGGEALAVQRLIQSLLAAAARGRPVAVAAA